MQPYNVFVYTFRGGGGGGKKKNHTFKTAHKSWPNKKTEVTSTMKDEMDQKVNLNQHLLLSYQ